MNRPIIVSLLSALMLLLAVGCQSATTAPTAPQTTTPVITPAPATPAPDPVGVQITAMTTEEKVGQLFIAGFEGTSPNQNVATLVGDYHMGGVILFSRNVVGARQLVDLNNGLKALNAGYDIPLFVSVDQEGGLVNRMPPEVHELPRAFDVKDAAAMGTALGAACKAFGFNVDFAPALDIWSNPKNTVIGKRAFGDQWEPVADNGPEAAYAIMAENVIPVVKHFPGHGDTATDSHVGLPSVSKTLEELRQAELMPFQKAIQGSSAYHDETSTPVPAVMVSHILLQKIDPDRPATLSPAVVTDLLRGEMGFTGAVFTDDMTMAAITQSYGLGEACVMAVEAGCDVLLVCHGQENIVSSYETVLGAVTSGRISPERLDESVRRILNLKSAYGLTDSPAPMPDLAALNARIDAVPAR